MSDDQTDSVICKACGSENFQDLPKPHPSQSMLSDGKIIQKPVAKVLCSECGLVGHRTKLKSEQVYAIYGQSYDLPNLTGEGDRIRAKQFADELSRILPERTDCRRFLDVGCGSGLLLSEVCSRGLAKEFVGIDPSLPPVLTTLDDNFKLINAFLGMPGLDIGLFDTIVSVNTIEHSADPGQFLDQLKRCLAPGGDIVVICPSNQPANVELLFYDHIWTLTPAAMSRFAEHAGLVLIEETVLAGALQDFRAYHIRQEGQPASFKSSSSRDFAATQAYLAAWSELDKFLLKKIGTNQDCVQIFGAGQMAALMRAYAPESFQLCKRLLVDAFEGAWPLGEIVRYHKRFHEDDWKTIIAVHPFNQAMLETRILKDGGIAIPLPTSIRH